MIENIIARKKECETLQESLETPTSQLIIVYGRRRVGKTFLINQFFDDNFSFKVTGIYNKPKEIQLEAFTKALNFSFKLNLKTQKNWFDAFDILKRTLAEQIDKSTKSVIFFDELPWMDTQKSDFLAAFEWFWNDWGCAQNNLLWIVCGSATSWMVDNIDHNKGGLFNRQNTRIYLEPFNLQETKEFLLKKNIEWSPYDIAECYMIMGGIPFYLSLLKPKFSVSQNIDNIFFKKKGELWDEFDHLYHTLFSNSEVYIKVVDLLSTTRIGYSRQEIAEKTKIAENGNLSKILNNLVYSGFVRSYPSMEIRKNRHYFNLVIILLYFILSFYVKMQDMMKTIGQIPIAILQQMLGEALLLNNYVKTIFSK